MERLGEGREAPGKRVDPDREAGREEGERPVRE